MRYRVRFIASRYAFYDVRIFVPPEQQVVWGLKKL